MNQQQQPVNVRLFCRIFVMKLSYAVMSQILSRPSLLHAQAKSNRMATSSGPFESRPQTVFLYPILQIILPPKSKRHYDLQSLSSYASRSKLSSPTSDVAVRRPSYANSSASARNAVLHFFIFIFSCCFCASNCPQWARYSPTRSSNLLKKFCGCSSNSWKILS